MPHGGDFCIRQPAELFSHLWGRGVFLFPIAGERRAGGFFRMDWRNGKCLCVGRGFVVSAGGEVYKVYVDSFFSGRGIGGALLEFAAAQTGASRLWVLEKNRKARAFYEKHGFLPTGEWTYEEGTPEKLLLLKRGEAGHGR